MLPQPSENAGRIGFVARRPAKDGARTRMAKNRLGLRGPVCHVQWRQHCAEARNSIVDNDKFRRARQLNRNDVASPNAKRRERRGKAFGLIERRAENSQSRGRLPRGQSHLAFEASSAVAT